MINQYAKNVCVEVVTAKTSGQLRELVNESLANNPFLRFKISDSQPMVVLLVVAIVWITIVSIPQ